MSKELNRMQKLAGVPVKKKSLNEHQIGGIVGVGAINQIPPREKSDYEMAFEHFMTEGSSDMARPGTEKEAEKEEMDEGYYEEDEITGTDIDDIEISSPPDFGDDEITGTSLEEEDDTMEEAVGIPASAEDLKLEILKIMNSHRSDSDLGAAIRKKFTPTFDDSYSSNRPTTMKDREEETRRNFAQRGMGAI